MLCEHCEIVGVVADGRALLVKARELEPDLVLADISMPLLNGIDAARQLKRSMPNLRFVFLTMMDDPKVASAAMRLAPVGYVLKHSAAVELLAAIDAVMQGKSFVTPWLNRAVSTTPKEQSKEDSKELTPRQREVLELVAKGCPMKEIADKLQISESTVQFHKYHIMKNFNLQSTAELVLLALKSGLISR